MNNKKPFQLLLISMLSLGFLTGVNAQETGTGFPDGIMVAMKTEITPKPDSKVTPQNRFSGSDTSSTVDGKHIIHRVFTDKENKLYIGYDLEIAPQTEKDKYKVFLKPLSIDPNKVISVKDFTAGSLPKFPNEVLVSDGDTISLDILQNPQTNGKVVDLFKITTKEKKSSYFAEREPAKDFTIDEVELGLHKSETFLNNTKVATIYGVSGPVIYFYLKGKGRFILSFSPHKGYDFQKIGMILDNEISFSFNGDKYRLTSTESILGNGGKWNLWVLYDPNYKSTFDANASNEFGGAETIESLFEKHVSTNKQ